MDPQLNSYIAKLLCCYIATFAIFTILLHLLHIYIAIFNIRLHCYIATLLHCNNCYICYIVTLLHCYISNLNSLDLIQLRSTQTKIQTYTYFQWLHLQQIQIRLPNSKATLLHCYIATFLHLLYLLHCYICYIAILLHCYIATLLHCYIATLIY